MVETGISPVALPVLRPEGSLRRDQGTRQFAVQFLLIKGRRQHLARNGFDNMIRITTNVRGNDGKSGSDGLQQNGTGVFHVGRMNQEISRRQKVRDVRSAPEELNASGDTQSLCQAQVWSRLILPDHHQPCLFQKPRWQVRKRDQRSVQPLGFES